jgi:CDP-diacylglycerol--serine O-phosphatidyltransferase
VSARSERLRRRRRPRGERRRAIYLLPNLVTTASLMLGFWSITQSIQGRWDWAAWGIVLAGFADMMDGRIARATRSTSKFGVEYDSLADLVSFGMAPALLVYNWALAPMGPRGWILASLFAICAALRLARFNVQQHVEERERYQGLPSTLAGGMTAVFVWFVSWLGLEPPFSSAIGLVITATFVGLALLMVSSVPYPSSKSLPVAGRQGFTTLVVLVLAIVLLLLYGEPAFFAIGVLYVGSGPVIWLAELRRPHPVPEPVAGESSDVG